MSTLLEAAPFTTTETDEETDTGEPKVSHIIRKDEKESASAKVMAAYVEGTPLVALCGFTWVPSRNPENYPICPKCLEVAKGIENFGNN